MDCIFCKLAGGEIPTATLYEDDDFRVILDQGPATKGHALILPKNIMQISMNFRKKWQHVPWCWQRKWRES